MEDSYILWPNSSICKISDPYVQGNLYKYIDCGIICHCEKKKVERGGKREEYYSEMIVSS